MSMTLAGVLHACFTGIESTPKITADDIKRKTAEDQPEQSYLSEIQPQPFGEWKLGKQFFVTDNKLSILLGPDAPKAGDLSETVISYQGAKDITSVSGKQVAELSFVTANGTHVAYRLDVPVLQATERKSVDIPLAIDLDLVNDVKRKMNGNTYYIITREWYDTANRPRSGRKYVPVKVTDVVPGSSFYPVLLKLTDDKGELFHLYMSAGNDLKDHRNFASLFSLSDPRLRYPSINDHVWQHIVNGTVTQDMTRDECRLSLGTPASVDRRPGYSILSEIWSYENGKYLIFEDGLLRSFRQ